MNQKLAERIGNDFAHHVPKLGQPELYSTIRDKARDLALLVASVTPEGREQALALTNLEQCVFWANAAIARNG